MTDAFSGEIRVASRIVDYLSSGLYNSPAACIKELVNNSYDADATRVDVLLKPDAERIIIADDGIGMTRKEFEQHFERVSESHKRDSGDKTASGRAKIGRIGIGFIAANELCDVMEIVSTKTGSTELLRVDVNFDEMRQDPSERRSEDGVSYVKGDYTGTIERARRSEHYTNVLLKQVRENTHSILAGATPRAHVAGRTSIYGRTPKFIRDAIANASDWGDFDEYSQTMLQVGLNVPVRYLPDWFPREHHEVLGRLERRLAALKFDVFCDGTDLRKPVVLSGNGGTLLRPLKIRGTEVNADGYLFIQHGVLRPQWLNGVLIRIRNAAVGEYDSSFMSFRSSEQTLFQRWTSCEVWADDRLEDALNIDRRTLRITHPAYVQLQEAFHEQLSSFLQEARKVLYTAPAVERRQKEARQEVGRLAQVIERPETGLPPSARRELARSARRRGAAERTATKRDIREIVRRYSVAEMYELVLSVAKDTLPRAHYQAFARALAERLLR